MMISWWSEHVGVILSVLMCDIWINVLLQTSALVGPLHVRKLVVYFHWLILRYNRVVYHLHNLLLFNCHVEKPEWLIDMVTNIGATQNRNSLSIPGKDNGFFSSKTHANRLPFTPSSKRCIKSWYRHYLINVISIIYTLTALDLRRILPHILKHL
jgi:hypothetical protein